jgi:hypothetical protein
VKSHLIPTIDNLLRILGWIAKCNSGLLAIDYHDGVEGSQASPMGLSGQGWYHLLVAALSRIAVCDERDGVATVHWPDMARLIMKALA